MGDPGNEAAWHRKTPPRPSTGRSQPPAGARGTPPHRAMSPENQNSPQAGRSTNAPPATAAAMAASAAATSIPWRGYHSGS
jgi:hypothetical protein